ncbi:hypothetical protein [Shumkonia mesophila]|uniref:hypothetical protein n=1 Tax=Shumkonia mesophila TaxID=2838854 RepID=UPI0029344C77|nr:hypothetical protein [Shumkonia mesophila]
MGRRISLITCTFTLIVSAWLAVLGVVASTAYADAKRIVLNCTIEEGAPQAYRSIQIMIDENIGIVIYNYQLVGDNYNREINKDTFIDLSMKISINDSKFMLANNSSGAFVITKHDGRFVHAFVTPIPAKDGNWVAFGNTHWGTCARSPFD